ncbi:YbgC/FadM family acyl-CoA thioesterase [Polycladidibacter stylochi]|uniref:YbgC/FadM family acyl-CoA thioesterase n=1 Tax=Polycladidibacter stylochi TaxID=1807766 RepID=UPI00082EE4A8|nr:YbgC/FadM family acyl-CoA thioesterase [Pseudovibrio stylochi]
MNAHIVNNLFETQLRVIFGDTDAGGIVYHPRYLEMAERGRNETMRALGLDVGAMFYDKDIGLALRSSNVKYRNPAHFDDALTVQTHLNKLASASSVWISTIRRGPTPICIVTAELICICRNTLRPIMYPNYVTEGFKRALAPIEVDQ